MAHRVPPYAEKGVLLFCGLCLLAVSAAAGSASDKDIRKFCAPGSGQQKQPLYLFLTSDINSQQSVFARNTTLQNGQILFSRKAGDSLFHTAQIAPGDCVLVNTQETLRLEAVEVSSEQGDSGLQRRPQQTTFLPAVFFVRKNSSKHYGLIEEKVLLRLTLSAMDRETATEDILNYAADRDLVLLYITCPADRNDLCDLTIKQNGAWLIDRKTGRKFSMKVLARARKNGSGSSRRISINSDTPQGIYTVWGTVTGGGAGQWSRTARIDLDAALPPINAQPYTINSFLLSRIIPDKALDDYWVNEWPLAYSLGRIALRIAPGDFEVQQANTNRLAFDSIPYNPTHGCINTGDQQNRLLQALVRAGGFAEDDVSGYTGGTGQKKWSVAPKLGKVFVILKDRD
ncbi:MAG: hypothetical protein ACL93V_15575 [Candidatus Electrothrix sp. YB6]